MTRPAALALVTIAALATATPATAQRLDDRFRASDLPTPATLAAPDAPTPTLGATAAPQVSAQPRSGFLWSVVRVLSGAVIGGGLGYVGTQIVRSDWDEPTDGSYSNQRRTWVAAGMVAGAVTGTLIGGRRRGLEPVDLPVPTPRDQRSIITGREIGESEIHNAYDIVHSLRPEWMRTRGTSSFRESARFHSNPDGSVTVTPGRDKIIAYLDNTRLGGVDELKRFTTEVLHSIEFIEPDRATLLFGGGHTHGVIRMNTTGDHP